MECEKHQIIYMKECPRCLDETTVSKSRFSALLCVCDIFTPMAWDDEDDSCAECGGVKKICYYDNVKAINKSLDAIDGILDDAKENDPEFYDELKELLNT